MLAAQAMQNQRWPVIRCRISMYLNVFDISIDTKVPSDSTYFFFLHTAHRYYEYTDEAVKTAAGAVPSEDLITLFLEDSIPRHVLSMTSLTKLLELVGSNGGDDPWKLLARVGVLSPAAMMYR